MLCEKVWGFVKRHSTVPSVAIIFAATWVFILAVQSGESGAAWVQAFGSIGAILAATHIANGDRRQARERERKKETVIYVALLNRLIEAKRSLELFNTVCNPSYYDGFQVPEDLVRSYSSRLEADLMKIRAIDLASLPDPRSVNALVNIISTFTAAIFIAKDCLDKFINIHGPRGPFVLHLIEVANSMKIIEEALAELNETWG